METMASAMLVAALLALVGSVVAGLLGAIGCRRNAHPFRPAAQPWPVHPA